MPFIHRRGYLKLSREGNTPGTLSTTQLLGAAYGPLSAMVASTGPFSPTSPGFGIPTLTREFEPVFNKHVSPMQVGRRFEDVLAVAARRELQGQFSMPVTPDAFGYVLFLALGADVVTATGSGTLTGAGNTANSTTLTVSALSANVKTGQRIWINDGANSEYLNIAANASSGGTSITVTGGAGTGGGLKFSHAATTPIQYGPWTHTFTPSNAASGIPTFQAEDNWGGAANSELYTAMSIDSVEISAPIENDTEAVTAIVKVVGVAPAAPGGVAGSGGFTLPTEEVVVAAGNAVTFTPTGATLPSAPFNNVYVPDLKVTITNTAKLVKASAGSPDPYTSLVSNFHIRGNADTIFEGYQTFQDYASTNIWNPGTFVWTWANQSLVGTAGAQAPTLTMTLQRMLLEKANKPTMKDDLVHLPIEAFRALDYPDFGGTNGPIASFALLNNVASY